MTTSIEKPLCAIDFIGYKGECFKACCETYITVNRHWVIFTTLIFIVMFVPKIKNLSDLTRLFTFTKNPIPIDIKCFGKVKLDDLVSNFRSTIFFIPLGLYTDVNDF